MISPRRALLYAVLIGTALLVQLLEPLAPCALAQTARAPSPAAISDTRVPDDGPWPDLDVQGPRRVDAPAVGLLEQPSTSISRLSADVPPLHPDIAQAAAALGNEPLALYNFVKTQIEFDPSYGQKRDPRRTLLERTGTDADQAGLLAALLRSAGVSASLRFGTVTVPLGK